MVALNKPFWIKIPYWPQWLAAAEVFLLSAMAGNNTGWLVMFLGQLTRDNPPFEVTKEETTWIASLVFLSRPIGIISGIAVTTRFGSKTSIYTSGFAFLVSWIVLIFAKSIYLVYVSLIFCGIGGGSYSCIYPIYVSEIADKRIRGALGSLVMHGYVVGTLMGNLMGAYLSPWTYGAVNLGPTIFYLCTFYFFPHTAYYLVNNKKMAEAEKSIRFYNKEKDAKKEMEILTKFLKESPKVSTLEALRRLNTPLNRRITFIVTMLYSVIQFSGIFAIIEYLEVIFTNAKVDVVSPSTLVILMSSSSIPACWIAIGMSDRFGRVTIFFWTCVMFFIALFSWGLHFHILSFEIYIPEMQYLVMICAFLYRTSINIGLIPIVPTILSELYAPDVKNIGSCIAYVSSAFCIFISSKNFQPMVDAIGYHYVFYMFSAVILGIGVYTRFCVPETKGKSLPEIQEMLNRSYKKNNVESDSDNKPINIVTVSKNVKENTPDNVSKYIESTNL